MVKSVLYLISSLQNRHRFVVALLSSIAITSSVILIVIAEFTVNSLNELNKEIRNIYSFSEISHSVYLTNMLHHA